MLRWNPIDPSDEGRPPEKVRFAELRVERGSEDGRRVRVHIAISSFNQSPNLSVSITQEDGKEAASIYIVETIEARMAFTMHLRGDDVKGPFTLTARLEYPEIGVVDERSLSFVNEV